MNFSGINRSSQSAGEHAAIQHIQQEAEKIQKPQSGQQHQEGQQKRDVDWLSSGNVKEFLDAKTRESLQSSQMTVLVKKQAKQNTEVLEKLIQDKLAQQFGAPKPQDLVQISAGARAAEAHIELPDMGSDQEELEELEEFLDDDPNSTKEGRTGVNSNRKIRRKYSVQQHIQQFKNPEETKELIKDYTKELLKVLKGQGSDKDLQNIRTQLLSQTKSPKAVASIESMVNQVVYQQHTYNLKQALLRQVFEATSGKRQLVQARFEANMAAKEIQSLIQKGSIKSTFPEILDYIKKELRTDMKAFLIEEAVTKFSHLIAQQGDVTAFKKMFKQLETMAKEAGVQILENEVSVKVLRAIDEMGLSKFMPPDTGTSTIDLMEGQAGGQQQQQQQSNQPVYVNQEQLFEEQLRDVYMLQMLNPGLGSLLQLRFKMRKIKQGIYKLGILGPKDLDRIKQEAQFLAQVRLVEMLRGAFREHATLPFKHLDPKNSKVRLVRQQISDCLKQLRKLDYPIKAEEIQRLKDEENRDIYAVLLAELKQAQMIFQVSPYKAVAQQCKLLEGMLERLRSETPSCEALPEELLVAIQRQIDVNS